jgi:hypothetical protein
VFFHNVASTIATITFTGNVLQNQGPYTAATIPGNSYALLGMPVPISGDVSNLTSFMGLVPRNSDAIQTFDPTQVKWTSTASYRTRTSNWSGPLTLNPGQGFFYHSVSSGNNTWVSNFTVN